jgi:hypothetical protein
MTLMFVLRARGGTVLMDLFAPPEAGGVADPAGAPAANATEARAGAAASEAWLAVPPALLAERPGVYALRLRGDTGLPAVEVAVVTPGPGTQLADADRAALQAVGKACCSAANARSPFCASM